uniref:Uncharacterized protein n=1 Tax=Pyxicephalus adspersus TaxID=30357 RepID=A0AAV3ANR9_PYXAD|nr:TPA: hypothetical protein GDO54_014650 [Pyxicephalus adspersus]
MVAVPVTFLVSRFWNWKSCGFTLCFIKNYLAVEQLNLKANTNAKKSNMKNVGLTSRSKHIIHFCEPERQTNTKLEIVEYRLEFSL